MLLANILVYLGRVSKVRKVSKSADPSGARRVRGDPSSNNQASVTQLQACSLQSAVHNLTSPQSLQPTADSLQLVAYSIQSAACKLTACGLHACVLHYWYTCVPVYLYTVNLVPFNA